jgi:hypothetical protein
VQVKSRTTSDELKKYVELLSQQRDVYGRMFFVYHSVNQSNVVALPPDADGVTLIGPDRLAQMALEAGLVQWLIDRTS